MEDNDKKNIDLAKLNTATKYPSIKTYHVMEEGKLKEERNFDFGSDPLIVTEKIDGTNARVVITSDGWFIGGRNELLGYQGDVLYNNENKVVDTLREWAENNTDRLIEPNSVIVCYFEVYGGRINAHKQYTSVGNVGFRIFDAWRMRNFPGFLASKTESQLSLWRDNNQQRWMTSDQLDAFAFEYNLKRVPLLSPCVLPASLEGASNLLNNYKVSLAALDEGGLRHSEGIVVRNEDRSKIAKLRFYDYQKATKNGAK